jgi:hypothetical protein
MGQVQHAWAVERADLFEVGALLHETEAAPHPECSANHPVAGQRSNSDASSI